MQTTEDLAGNWITVPESTEDAAENGIVSLQFTKRGNLLYTQWKTGQETVSFLRYQVVGEQIVFTNPDDGFTERLRFAQDRRGRLHVEDQGRKVSFVRGEPQRSFEISSALIDLAVFGTQQAFERICGNERLSPFIITENDGARDCLPFKNPERQKAVVEARQMIQAVRERVQHSTLHFDGYISGGPEKQQDAIFTEAFEVGQSQGIVLAQPYATKRMLRPARQIGPILYCGRCEALL